MRNLKKNLLYITLLTVIAAAGCANGNRNTAPRSANASPTPTRSISFWATATPTPKATATPTMTLDEALNQAEKDVRDKYGDPTATPTPETSYYVPATPTPGAKNTATPTPKPALPTATPTARPTNTPTTAPTKSPTKTPTKTPTPTPKAKPTGTPTATYLMDLLFDKYPELMATTSIKVDLPHTSSDGEVTNLYYTVYKNQESYENIVHTSNDVWITTATSDEYKCDQTYEVINSSNVKFYFNENDSKTWTKKTLAAGSVQKGVDIIPKDGIVTLLNPKLTSKDSTTGYEIQMDCAVDLSDILKTLTNGAYTRKFNKTFKATAVFDYKTLQPTLFLLEAENTTVSTEYTLAYLEYRVDNIIDNISALEVPKEAK